MHICNDYFEKAVALSSTEAEYAASSEATKAVPWLWNLVNELNVHPGCTSVYEDNPRAIELVNVGSSKYFSRRKHIDIRHNYVTEMIQRKQITLTAISTRHL